MADDSYTLNGQTKTRSGLADRQYDDKMQQRLSLAYGAPIRKIEYVVCTCCHGGAQGLFVFWLETQTARGTLWQRPVLTPSVVSGITMAQYSHKTDWLGVFALAFYSI